MTDFAFASFRVLHASAILLLALLGCSAHAPPQSADRMVPLVFANESAAQAPVWVVAPNVKTRPIGVVMAGATETLRVPSVFCGNGTISFYTRLRGSTASPGIYDLRTAPDEPLRLRLTRDMKSVAIVR